MITNIRELARTPLRKKALTVAEAGYEAIDIEKMVKERIRLQGSILRIGHKKEVSLNLDEFEKIFIVGIGKGSALASATLAEILGTRLAGGIALDVFRPRLKIENFPPAADPHPAEKLKILNGTHPLPSETNISATQKIMALVKNLNEKDLLITFICGGGSALACASKTELEASTKVVKALTKAGADITELNTARKHLSEFKAGGLAKMSCPATLFSLIVSDVCGNDLATVSSGPTVYDKTTKVDAENILKKYGLNPADFPLIETPKDEECFRKTRNMLFACNEDAVNAMLEKANELGFRARIFDLALKGEARNVFKAMIRKLKNNEALLAAGETTVSLGRGKVGKGGRNLEAVLGAINMFHDSGFKLQDAVAMSLASDGRDNTEAAGAIGDIETIEIAQKLGLNIKESLDTHDTFAFFEKTGDLIFTEPKSFNVADLMLILRQ